MPIGFRPVSDARSRSFADPEVQAAWSALDCGFAPVADVFEECANEALAVLSASQFSAYIEPLRGFRWIGVLPFLHQASELIARVSIACRGGTQ